MNDEQTKTSTSNRMIWDIVKIPNFDYDDYPFDWPYIPQWLEDAFQGKRITSRFLTEDYWYFVINGATVAPDNYVVAFTDDTVGYITSEELDEFVAGVSLNQEDTQQ